MKYSVAVSGLSTRNAVVFLHKKEERTAAKYFPIPSLLPMKRELLLNSDGSHTVAVPGLQVTYHSVHGAVPESRHVFIEAGLKDVLIKPSVNNTCIRIFETGFGAGLNALLFLRKRKKKTGACITSLPSCIHNHQKKWKGLTIYAR